MKSIKKFKLVFLFLFLFSVSAYSQSTSQIIDELYNGASDVVEQSKDLITLSVQAVWLASELTNTPTITGTLTQSASNPNYWTYSANPTDKLVVAFSNGYSISFTFTTINGYTEGEAEDFIDNHVMDFISVVNGSLNLRVQSQTGPNGDNTEWNRTITGDTEYNGNSVTTNISTYGFKHLEVGSGYAFGDFYDEYTGTISSATVNFNINERETIHNAYSSNDALYVHERHVHNNSSASGSFGTYSFQELYCFYVGSTQFADSANAGYYSSAIEVYNWVAQGELHKNGAYYGSVQFSSTPVENTYGPKLVANCQDGNSYELDPLLNWYLTGVENEENTKPADFVLEQNYPNPFSAKGGSTTNITYVIASGAKQSQQLSANNEIASSQAPRNNNIRLTVYDALGRKVATLVNKKQAPGNYTVQFDASKLSSGIYFYTLRAGNFSATKKMILMK